MDSATTLIGSIVIAGIFLLGLNSFYGDVFEHSYEKTFELLAQETTASFMEIIEHDFRRIGSAVSSQALAIVQLVDSTDITFLADVDHNGTAETVRYYTSDPADASATENPNDVILYRVVNGTNTIDTPAGVTSFSVRVLDWTGNATTELMAASMLDVALTVESVYPYDDQYMRAVWRKRITPENLYRNVHVNF